MVKKRRLRIWALFLTLVIVVVAGGWAVWIVVVPPLVEQRIRETLAEGGLRNVSVSIGAITHQKTVLRDLVIENTTVTRAEEVVVRYSPFSLLRGKVGTVELVGVETEMRLTQDRLIWGPLEQWRGGEPDGAIPFDRLLVRSAHVHFMLNDTAYSLVLTGSADMPAPGGDSATLRARAAVAGAALDLDARVDVATFGGGYGLRVAQAPTGLLEQFRFLYAPDAPWAVAGKGTVTGTAEFVAGAEPWSLRVACAGESTAVKAVAATLEPEPVVYVDSLRLYLSSAPTAKSTAEISGSAYGGRYGVEARFDLMTFRGEYEAGGTGLDAQRVVELLRELPGTSALEAQGMFDLRVQATYAAERVEGTAQLIGRDLEIARYFDDLDIRVLPDTVRSDVHLAQQESEWHARELWITVDDSRVVSNSLKLDAESVSAAIPLVTGKNSREGEFTIREIRFGGQPFPAVSGTFGLENERIEFEARSTPLPEAQAFIDGLVAWGGTAPSGHIDFTVPRFTLVNEAVVARWVPALAGDRLNGTYEAKGRVSWTGQRVQQRVETAVTNGTWRRPSEGLGALGVSGGMTLTSVAPPRTAVPGRFFADSAYAGGVGVADVTATVSVGRAAPVVFRKVQCWWAGGTLEGNDIALAPDKSGVRFPLTVEGVRLQQVLDFFDYQGARASGRVYGTVPLTLNWNGGVQIALGEGSLYTRPATGTVKFTEQAAMTILGIKERITEEGAGLEDQVRLMILRALQDMLYTQLRVAFETQPDGTTVAVVQLEGRGPHGGDEEQQMPIGGLEVRIHNVEGIINRLIEQGGRGRIEFR